MAKDTMHAYLAFLEDAFLVRTVTEFVIIVSAFFVSGIKSHTIVVHTSRLARSSTCSLTVFLDGGVHAQQKNIKEDLGRFFRGDLLVRRT